jgi:hypothetical protein
VTDDVIEEPRKILLKFPLQFFSKTQASVSRLEYMNIVFFSGQAIRQDL